MTTRQAFSDLFNNTRVSESLTEAEKAELYSAIDAEAKKLLPKSLFRYRACNENNLSAFEKDEIWFSTADCMNDGFDARAYISKENKEKILAQIENTFKAYNKEQLTELLKKELLPKVSPETQYVDGALAQIDAAINMVHKQLGINDSEEDDEQIEYADGGVYAVPEANYFSIVLDEIAKSALNTLGMDNTDSCMVNLMGTILFGISTGEKDSIVVGRAYAELVGSGSFLDRDTIKDIYNKTHDKCQLQILGLKIAIDNIRYYNCSAEETLAQIAIFL